MEIAAVDPLLLSMSDAPGIKAGMMSVIPTITEEMERAVEEARLEYDPEQEQISLVPEKTLLCAGQSLSRELYPRLSSVFASDGGFYSFSLPDLRGKFILGVNEDGEFIMGDAVIYYEDVPDATPPSRNIRDYA